MADGNTMHEDILLERRDRVALLQLNRPQRFNALSSNVMQRMIELMAPLDRDPDVGCLVITGSEKAFAAGADMGFEAQWNRKLG